MRKKSEKNPKAVERIYQILDEQHLSQAKLATMLGMTQQNLSRIIRMKNSVTYDTAKKIHALFPVYPETWIMGYDDSIEKHELHEYMIELRKIREQIDEICEKMGETLKI